MVIKDRDSHHIKDLDRETRQFRRRAILFFVIIFVMALGLLGRMFFLQVVDYQRFATQSDSNRMTLQSIPPNRGLIYDTNGKLLAENRASQSLSITPERVDDFDNLVAELDAIVGVSDDGLESYKRRLGQYRRPYEAVPLKLNLTQDQIAHIAVNAHRLKGVSIEAQLVRHYPYAESTAHVLGYVGRINEAELEQIDEANYRGTKSIGKLGVEKFYEDELHGKVGYQEVEINARGRVLRVLEKEAPQPGADIQLFLDSEIQQAAEDALGDRRGAVVAIDPRTGGIVALVSKPGYDPNLFVTGIDAASYAELRDSLDLPLFNRAVRGQYPPGSTIKPFVGLAALEYGYTDWERSIYDVGWYQLEANGRHYRDWKKYGHGRVNLEAAITQSCDTYFYELAYRMGIDPIHDFMNKFGFGRRTALDIGEALGGILPSSAWKKAVQGEPWYRGDSLNASIGQGYMLATPLQLATAMAVLANRGKWVQPRLVDRIITHSSEKGADQESSRELKPQEDVVLKDSSNWERMINAMESVVHGQQGTARALGNDLDYRMAGKSGTAQVIGIKQDEEYDADKIAERNQDHALFVAFAPADDPLIAVAVIVENGGGGGSNAGPVARAVMDAYIAKSRQTEREQESD